MIIKFILFTTPLGAAGSLAVLSEPTASGTDILWYMQTHSGSEIVSQKRYIPDLVSGCHLYAHCLCICMLFLSSYSALVNAVETRSQVREKCKPLKSLIVAKPD